MEGITFSSDLKGKMSMEDHIEGAEMMNDYFKTQEHGEEMQVNMNNINWVHNNILDFYNVIKFNGKIIGSTFMMPCTKLIMDKFLSKKLMKMSCLMK